MEPYKEPNIPAKFLKPYDPKAVEDSIYSTWLKSGYFNPDNLPPRHKEAFSIMLPPPNVTGTLHIGHASMLVIEDIMVRYKRMMGFKTLWIPGTDHAAIATQSKVESEIYKKEGKRRQDLGREELLKRVNAFAQESHDTITNQIKKMGASIDWSREAYTLDAKRELAVFEAFKKMHEDGLIYRGHRIVNWDPKGQTTISDDEIIYTEEKTKFYYFKYGPFTIGTARPETKFGDKYVVMHPSDERYSKFKHGDQIDLEWINGPIKATIIKDESEYGMPMPEEFGEVLDQDHEADKYFHSLTAGKQRSLIYIVSKVKNTDSRIRKSLAIADHITANRGSIDYKLLNEAFKEYNKM